MTDDPRVGGAIAILGGSMAAATAVILDFHGLKKESRMMIITSLLVGGILGAVKHLSVHRTA